VRKEWFFLINGNLSMEKPKQTNKNLPYTIHTKFNSVDLGKNIM
jgi:hypothetical protein